MLNLRGKTRIFDDYSYLSAREATHCKGLIPFIKTNDTKKVRIIVCFRGLKKSRILIAILGFLSPLKRTIIRAFSVISFYKWYQFK